MKNGKCVTNTALKCSSITVKSSRKSNKKTGFLILNLSLPCVVQYLKVHLSVFQSNENEFTYEHTSPIFFPKKAFLILFLAQ